MAMAHFDVSLAYDQIVKRGVPGQVARVSDADTDLPYTDLLDLDGNPLAALVSNSQGYVPPFQIQDGPALVKMSVGGVTYYLQDLNLFGETNQAAQQAAADAQKAAALVEAPADEVVATLVQGETLTQTAGDARWVTNMGADATVSALFSAPDSEVQAAADARYLRVDNSAVPPLGQVTYHWEGVPHLSASVKKVDGVVVERNLCRNPSLEAFRTSDDRPLILALNAPSNAVVTTGGSATPQASTVWADSSQHSCKLTSAGSPAGSLYIWGASQTPEALGLERDKQYTLSATVHLETPQTNPTHVYQRALNIGVNRGDATDFDFASSAIPPNEPGSYRVSVAFTVTQDVVSMLCRAMNGSPTAGDEVFFDSFKLSESTDTTYFDGDSQWKTSLWSNGGKVYRWDGDAWVDTEATPTGDELGWLDEMQVLTRWNLYEADTATMFLQGFSIDEERKLIYCSYGRGANNPHQRFEVRNYEGERISYREIVGEPQSYTEGIPWWYDGNDLKMIVRVDASATLPSTYRIYNYTTNTLGSPIEILGKVRADVLGNFYVTSDAYGTSASEFYIYDWASVKSGAPTLLSTIELEGSGTLDFKIQAATATNDYLFIYGASGVEPPTILVYNWRGKFVGSRRWSVANFKDAVNSSYPGIMYASSPEYEAEGMCQLDGSRIALGHVYLNLTADGRQFMITVHGRGGPKAQRDMLYRGI